MYIEGVCYVYQSLLCDFCPNIIFPVQGLDKKKIEFWKNSYFKRNLIFYYLSWSDILPVIGNNSVYNERHLT